MHNSLKPIITGLRPCGLLFALCITVNTRASEPVKEDKTELNERAIENIMVIGSQENISNIPGSAQLVTRDDIRQQNYDDINRALIKVPGVYVRQEDGFGLFSNISLRGVDTTRSAKLTMMEDGILIAPAPYSAPSAYYSPTAGRMNGLEILKGSSQIKFGPHTTGGVINYLSTPIPNQNKMYLKATFGDFNERRYHAYVGNKVETKVGEVGFVFEGFKRDNNGFKSIDETPDFRNGSDTGFGKLDGLFKASWSPNSEIYQLLEFKYANSALNANETYLGLTKEDFRANPVRRYSASRFDNIDSKQSQRSLRYSVSPSQSLDIVTTVYQTDFRRNWYKLSKTAGQKPSIILAEQGQAFDCIRGLAACDLKVKANNRWYSSQGVESMLFSRFDTGNISHEVVFGIRKHKDDITRFQWEDTYIQAQNGSIAERIDGIPGDAGNRYQQTKALALFLQDTVEFGNWTITPGVRYEMLEQISEDPKGTLQSSGGSRGRDGENSFNMQAIGIGATYEFNQSWSSFAGIHTGFSPPSPRATRSGLDPETSTATEFGVRFSNLSQSLVAEAVLFHTAFADLIVVDNVGGAGSGESENFGEVISQGLEFSVQYDAGYDNDWNFRNPYFLNLTYTDATQQNDANSTDPESIFSYGKKGNKVPYIPELTFSIGGGLETDKWSTLVTASYVGATFTSANNVNEAFNGDGNPDIRFGKTDSYFVLDFSANYIINDKIKIFAGVQNLLDNSYIVSRQPDGVRGGVPRFIYTGLEVDL
ncbi:MAG: TonB-dependent receptor [Proteobacteria bacterium]|nr:TonB-dependent receptor [Pseudomonadota bacterium]